MITFKQFLHEGGKETAAFGTQRANAADIKKALEVLSDALGEPTSKLQKQVLGSVELTLMGKRVDSGDVDIAYSIEEMESAHAKMMKAVNDEGHLNKGTKVGSYAVDVGNKKIQVDLMFVDDVDWAKFAYHSSEGDKSKYKGAVRNILFATALAHTQEPGKDFVLRDEDGSVVARASRSFKLGTGMERLFKMRKKNKKTGEWLKTLETVTPEQLKAEFGDRFKFDPRPDIIRNPDAVAAFIFGGGVKAKDVMTAEDVIKLIKKRKDAKTILTAAKEELTKAHLPIPKEL